MCGSCFRDRRYHTKSYYVYAGFMGLFILILHLAPYACIQIFAIARMHAAAAVVSCLVLSFPVAVSLLAYFRTMFCDVAVNPQTIVDSLKDAANIDYSTNIPEQEMSAICKRNGWRFCEKCHLPKPPRSHHCSICKQCVLKMDHHCPWMNNCVGFHNHKHFILYLGWTSLSLLIAVLISAFTIALVDSPSRYYIGNFLLGAVIMFCAVMFLTLAPFMYTHIRFIYRGTGTIEPHYNDVTTQNKYFISKRANWELIFGKNSLLWFFPVDSFRGDGLNYPTNPSYVESSGTTDTTSEE